MGTRLRAGSEGGSSEEAPSDSLCTLHSFRKPNWYSCLLPYRLQTDCCCQGIMLHKMEIWCHSPARNHRRVPIDLMILDTNFRAQRQVPRLLFQAHLRPPKSYLKHPHVLSSFTPCHSYFSSKPLFMPIHQLDISFSIVNIPHQSDTFITINEPTVTRNHHLKSIFYVRFTLGVYAVSSDECQTLLLYGISYSFLEFPSLWLHHISGLSCCPLCPLEPLHVSHSCFKFLVW